LVVRRPRIVGEHEETKNLNNRLEPPTPIRILSALSPLVLSFC
jgi:hypothetical protein